MPADIHKLRDIGITMPASAMSSQPIGFPLVKLSRLYA